IFFVPSIILLMLELRRTTPESIRISKVSGSEAHLSVKSVAQSLTYYVDALPGVVRVRPQLITRGHTIHARLDVDTTPDIDVRAKTEEITQTARNVVEERLGLKLGRLHLHIHPAPFPQRNALPPLKPARDHSAPLERTRAEQTPAPVENHKPLSE
ncbi:MAG: alkaline shock response membrane anchor protein AmaP, partial [Chloroflexi bacterium]|nr:alkaline shock response membrane anchor protein AmaP [Chloroflexota bacterium]